MSDFIKFEQNKHYECRTIYIGQVYEVLWDEIGFPYLLCNSLFNLFHQTQGRESIAAKLVANIITEAGANRVLACDLHSGQSMGYFDIPVDHVNCHVGSFISFFLLFATNWKYQIFTEICIVCQIVIYFIARDS